MMRGRCEYLEAPTSAWTLDAKTGRETEVIDPEPSLCGWAIHAAPKLKDTPPWLPRNAEAGYLWRPGDCDECPCHVPRVT